MNSNPQVAVPLIAGVKEAASILGIGQTKVYDLMRRRLVTLAREAAQALLIARGVLVRANCI